VKPNADKQTQEAGRWIKPASLEAAAPPSRLAMGSVDDLGSALLTETRRRVSGLAALERDLEDRIRDRWAQAEGEVRRLFARAEEEVAALRRKADAESKERWLRSEKEGRAAGFREGFARGREEGSKLGLEEGRRDGEQSGREDATRRVEEDLATAAAALSEATAKVSAEKDRLLGAAKRDLLTLALEIAGKVIKREVREPGGIALRQVERAVDLIFRRGSLVVQVSPEDAPAVEKALDADPRWAEGFDSVEVRAAADVSRGGCRLISGAGSVDMNIETQLGLIEEALAGIPDDDEAPAAAGTSPGAKGGAA
jgi:flagellar assembly protein FliH